MDRFWKYEEVPEKLWKNWRWQLRNRIQNSTKLYDYFPNMDASQLKSFYAYAKNFNIGITPYMLSLIELDKNSNPIKNDPLWKQFRFHPLDILCNCNEYDGIKINWECAEEMPTAILHHKYPDRALIRITNNCFGYCNYCYLTHRTLDIKQKKNLKRDELKWRESLRYLIHNPQIEDVLISGGDPLILNDSQIERILFDISKISTIKTIRLNTRTLTFNPFRITKELVRILKKYRITVLEVHIVHPYEITEVFDETLNLFDNCKFHPLILWRSPLLKGINDSYEVLRDLLLKLFQRRILPYYLFHYTPYSLGRSIYGTSIRKGVKLMLQLRRTIPGPAFPRYTLFHLTGKHDIPLELSDSPTFKYLKDPRGNPIVKFKNWHGQWVTYPDEPEENI
ncbi:MAG: KamA family radical SAM protein [bacterium]